MEKSKKNRNHRVGSWENESWENGCWQRELLRLKIKAKEEEMER